MKTVLFFLALVIGSIIAIVPEIADVKTPPTSLLQAIEQVESAGRFDAVGDHGDAVGVLQIRPVMVEDCNRILGRTEFTLADRWSRERSEEMFTIYTDHYSYGCGNETITRRWNGGPRGEKKATTAAYWAKVKALLVP